MQLSTSCYEVLTNVKKQAFSALFHIEQMILLDVSSMAALSKLHWAVLDRLRRPVVVTALATAQIDNVSRLPRCH
ncbi:hypothetical protein GX51_00123 [Blastomyces parvus]|uniref:Uncharacterized protein n=1 Tax=Blastomyces parvus TaxID=2060905 RepID=A0A2B7XMK1_9EURO|nr:hypothetical protein GX51_00123 [Blastomyces parvus]